MFDLIVFTLEIFENSRFLDYVVGKFFPLHVSVPIYIDLVKKVSQITYQPDLSIG